LESQIGEILKLIKYKKKREKTRQTPKHSQIKETGNTSFGGQEIASIEEASVVMKNRLIQIASSTTFTYLCTMP